MLPMISHSILTQNWRDSFALKYFSLSLHQFEKYIGEKGWKANGCKTRIYLTEEEAPQRERCDREGLDQIEFLLGIHFQICHSFCIHHLEYVYILFMSIKNKRQFKNLFFIHIHIPPPPTPAPIIWAMKEVFQCIVEKKKIIRIRGQLPPL